MRRLLLVVLTTLCILAWSAAFYSLQSSNRTTEIAIPTVLILPSVTSTQTLTSTSLPSSTPTPSATLTPTYTPTVSLTPTLSTRVLEITVIMPGVTLPPTLTPIPPNTTLLAAPPQPVEPLPDATDAAPPFAGWYSFESDYPAIRYQPAWTPRLSQNASRGQYHRTESAYSTASFAFEGEGLRMRYVMASNMGIFEIVVDGVVIDKIDAYAEELGFPATDIYFVGQGTHLLQIRATGRKDARSEGYVVGLDAVQVYRADAHTLIIPPPEFTNTPSPTPRPVRVELIAAPPTVQPTPTPVPPRSISASVVIAYDENGNRVVDPAEGVSGISVRMVDTTTNRVIASGFTDSSGYVGFEVMTDSPMQIVVPYFAKAWEVRSGNSGTTSAFTLLLTPGNQPGLIP